MNPRLKLIKDVCTIASAGGLKLALWQKDNQWFWAWKRQDGLMLGNGSTDAAPQSIALLFACEDIRMLVGL